MLSSEILPLKYQYWSAVDFTLEIFVCLKADNP